MRSPKELAFENVARPTSMDLSTSEGGIKCPEGKVPCNPRAEPTDVYCVDPEIVSSD